MSLEIKVKQILEHFEDYSSTDIVEILNQIQSMFQNHLTQDYLRKKLISISISTNEEEKKKLCKTLTPYFYWYLQGL